MELTNREKYLLGISWKEKMIRDSMDCQRGQIKQCKKEMKTSTGIAKSHIKWAKARFTAYRHELHRIKGMDNISRIKGAWYEDVAESNLGYCKCGNLLIEVGVDKKPWDVYCRKCGRKIFWREQ